jgi:hypothetical protein
MSDRGGSVAVRELCSLAASGRLAEVVRELPEDGVRGLRRAAYEIAVPLVWSRHTRPLELRRGHPRCARNVTTLQPDCADGFSQDLDAVVGALLSYGPPIGNVPGWLVRRMENAIKDGHRKRRGELGAQQRVRVPAWLATRLGEDPWLVELARLVLEWVGVPATAGASTWPLEAWAEERARRTGDWQAGTPAMVERDLRTVLGEMREGRPHWYARFVADPLSRKEAAAHLKGGAVRDGFATDGLEQYEAGLRELAGLTLTAIADGLSAGDEPAGLVTSVVSAVFLGAAGTRLELHRSPDQSDQVLAGRIHRLLTDPDRCDRFVREVLVLADTTETRTALA